MKNLTIGSLFAAALFLFANGAEAATLDITLGLTNNSAQLGFSSGGSLNPNINLITPSPAVLTPGLNAIITDITTPQHTTPSGTLYQNNYLAILGDGGTGSATLTLGANENKLGFTWGTIDNYNTLFITDSRNVTYTISGTQLLNHILGSIAGTTQSDVSFYDPYGSIVSAELQSTQDAFEAGNFSESNVPLPASLPLFGAALLGLGALAYQRKSKA